MSYESSLPRGGETECLSACDGLTFRSTKEPSMLLVREGLFDKRSFGLRQTLVWASTSARLGLDKRSFVPRLPIVCKRSNGGLVFVVQSRGTDVPIEGTFRCFLGGVAMLSKGFPNAVYGIPSMVIRDPFDGYPRPLRWLSGLPLMEIRFLSLVFQFLAFFFISRRAK